MQFPAYILYSNNLKTGFGYSCIKSCVCLIVDKLFVVSNLWQAKV